MNDDTTTIEIEEVLHETDAALKVVIEGDEYWVPKSQIHEDSEVFSKKSAAESNLLTVRTWWAEKEGLA